MVVEIYPPVHRASVRRLIGDAFVLASPLWGTLLPTLGMLDHHLPNFGEGHFVVVLTEGSDTTVYEYNSGICRAVFRTHTDDWEAGEEQIRLTVHPEAVEFEERLNKMPFLSAKDWREFAEFARKGTAEIQRLKEVIRGLS